MVFYSFGKDKKNSGAIKPSQIEQAEMSAQKFDESKCWIEQQKTEYQRIMEEEKRRREFETLIKQQEVMEMQKRIINSEILAENSIQKSHDRLKKIKENNNNRSRLQEELMECSRIIRDIQKDIKEMYQFEPCRQLCEVLVNIRQNVYQNMGDIQEDIGYVIEGFGISEFSPKQGELFDAKYHKQVYSELQDARGKEINCVYASGFEMDGEVIVKAQVSVKD